MMSCLESALCRAGWPPGGCWPGGGTSSFGTGGGGELNWDIGLMGGGG